MTEYVVEMRNITKRFPGIVANDSVTIQIKEGEVYALLGENGAGKSTLMSILFGMYEPDEGEIYVRGKREVIRSPRHAAALRIGMVHQHFKLVNDYTITENIILGMEPVRKYLGVFPGVDIKAANDQIAQLSAQYGLKVDPTRKIRELKVAEKQRVEILKMLYRDAQILIFDEPTAVLTPQEITFLLDIIRGLKEAGKTIILITHKLEEIRKVADRCAILCRGRLMDVVEVASVSTREMANKMVGREVSLMPDKSPARYGRVVLSVQDLTVRDENKFEVVKKVSFSIRGGEILAIAGVAGNGQTEIAEAIAGLLAAAEGRIVLEGKDITEDTVRRRIRRGISYIPEDRQALGLILDLTLGENLVLKNYDQQPFARKGRMDHPGIEKYSEKLIGDYDIRCSGGSKTQVRSMSGGNQQKAIIAREIRQDGSLLIFVQPTRGLDVGAIERIHGQIMRERDRGKAILLISLELEEIMSLADTIAVIYNGELRRVSDAKEISVEDIGELMMGVKRE